MKLKLSTKLILLFLIVGVTPALTISYLVIKNSEKQLRKVTFQQLQSFREIKKEQMLNFFNVMEKQVITMSGNAFIVEAMKDFRSGFFSYKDEWPNVLSDEKISKELFEYYKNDFSSQYSKLNNDDKPEAIWNIFNSMGETEKFLQYNYIRENKNPLGSKHLLDKALDHTSYSNYHEKYHPTIRKFLETFKYYDIFLVDSETGHIVYSVFKELDYGTSLINGPYSKTNFAQSFFDSQNATNKDFVSITDLKAYFPSYEAAAGFISSPIYDGDKKIGVLIFQIPVDKIDSIMTNNKRWRENGLGESGETYLIGEDFKMRGISRFLSEDPENYFKMVEELGLEEKTIKTIKAKQTTSLLQEVRTEGTSDALNGKADIKIFKDYRGVSVISAYRPLTFKGLKWALMAEMDEVEALASVALLKKIILIVVGISTLLIIGFVVYFSRSLSRPMAQASAALGNKCSELSGLSNNLGEVSDQLSASSSEQAAATQESVSAMEEMTSMIEQTNEFARTSQELATEVKTKTNEGDRTMKQLVSSMDLIRQANTQLQNMINIINDIANKTEVINDIVFQTKLLSFNASIEAARAGQHGKGFAVVAEEVGNLARSSGNAAEEIKTLILDSQNQVKEIVNSTQSTVQEGQEVSNKASSIFEDISGKVGTINDHIQKIHDASREQSEGVKQTTEAIKQMDEAAKSNERVAHQTSEYSNSLMDFNKSILGIVRVLRFLVFGDVNITGKDQGTGGNGGNGLLGKLGKSPSDLDLMNEEVHTGKEKEISSDLVDKLVSKKMSMVPKMSGSVDKHADDFERVSNKTDKEG